MGKYFLAVVCFALLCAGTEAQQNNLQVLPPPALDILNAKTRDISGGYSSITGDRVNIGALDINTVFGARTGSVYDSFSVGAALLGGAGPESVYFGAVKKDLNGVTIHMSGSRHYLYGKGEYPRCMLLASIPVSFGSFTIGNNNKEEIRVYNLLAGLQGGVAANIKTGKFLLTPSAMFSLMGGYRERYDDGVYLANLKSGTIRPFGTLTLGADLAYWPGQFKLSAIYQRAFSSGEDRATDSLTLKFTLGWDVWGRKPASDKGAL